MKKNFAMGLFAIMSLSCATPVLTSDNLYVNSTKNVLKLSVSTSIFD